MYAVCVSVSSLWCNFIKAFSDILNIKHIVISFIVHQTTGTYALCVCVCVCMCV